MSMLSAQCDELRERAATLRQGRWSDGVDDARLMEDAADTIWELRDDLQRANAENSKLRELCKDMMAFVEDDDACERCGHDAECVEAADGELVLPYEGQCLMLDLFADRMRELGIEVDG